MSRTPENHLLQDSYDLWMFRSCFAVVEEYETNRGLSTIELWLTEKFAAPMKIREASY